MKYGWHLFIVYVLMALFTYGYATVHHKCKEYNKKYDICDGDAQIAGMGAAYFWPAYWSLEIQERLYNNGK